MATGTFPVGPIEKQLHDSYDELTDKMLVSQYNTLKKKRLKMDIDSEVLDAEMREAGNLVDERTDTYMTSDGWAAVVEDEQASLFDQAQ